MSTYDEWLAGGARHGVVLASGEHGIFVRSGGAGGWCTLLHGFPTSSHDWHRVWDALAARHRLLAFDFLGFGDSDKPREHDYTIHEQADLTDRLWSAHGVDHTELVVHDYAVSVAQELLARQEERRLSAVITRVVFLNGGLYPELHRPQPGQLMLLDPETGPQMGALMTGETFGRSLLPTFAPTHQPSDADLEAAWQGTSRRDGQHVMHRLIRYIRDRQQHRDRWVGALEATTSGSDGVEHSGVPRHFVWGMLDPVSGAHMAERIAQGLPDAELIRLDDVGHWPQLEAPERVASHLVRMLG